MNLIEKLIRVDKETVEKKETKKIRSARLTKLLGEETEITIQEVSGNIKFPEQDQYKNASENSEFFTDNGKNHIVLCFRHKAQLLKAAPQSSAENATTSDGIQPLDRLETFFIFFRISPDGQTLQPVTFRCQKYCNKTDSRTSKPDKLHIFRIGYKNQDYTDSQNNDRCDEVV